MLHQITRNERVIIVEDDQVRSVVIGPRQRLRPAFFVGAAMLVTMAAIGGWLVTAAELQQARREAAYVQQGADVLASALDQSRNTVEGLAHQLATARDSLDSARAQETTLRSRLAAVSGKLEAGSSTDGRTTPSPRSLQQVIASAKNELDQVQAQTLTTLFNTAEQALAEATEANLALGSRRSLAAVALVDLGGQSLANPAPVSLSDGLGPALVAARADLAVAQNQAQDLSIANTELTEKAESAEQRMQTMTDAQVALFARLTQNADLRIDAMEDRLKDTGIDLNAVLSRLNGTAVDNGESGVGGPLVSLPQTSDILPAAANEAMTQLEDRLDRQNRLRTLVSLLPFSAPVDDFYISSGFGKRPDPFTHKAALHTGLDMVADLRSPVMATAPGRVVTVGWDDGYGRLVEIDHGFGIHTRYGHLDKALVKEGDRVVFGQQIGNLGNSGRSSGPHVHYEILIGGQQTDPMRFMEKGRHVCEG